MSVSDIIASSMGIVNNHLDEALSNDFSGTTLVSGDVAANATSTTMTSEVTQQQIANQQFAQDIVGEQRKMEGGNKPPRPALSDEDLGTILDSMMGTIDTSGDGLVTTEEFMAARPQAGKSADKIFTRFDVDGDGSLNADEFAASQMMKFIKDSFPDMQGFLQFLEHNGIAKDAVLTREQVDALREARLAMVDELPRPDQAREQGPQHKGPDNQHAKPHNPGLPPQHSGIIDDLSIRPQGKNLPGLDAKESLVPGQRTIAREDFLDAISDNQVKTPTASMSRPPIRKR